ncbi:alpha/beta hydrolase [Paenibacillus sp. N1-5-1-14]|uniref:intracellular short-chain-length polyhydroxyalkanoate depolymerase n=1 Tax=Paenibacillus radicibacter TaxID=2972488 RepID=UPI0021590BE3|nr:alpha/beta hydrolase [Paenibacillus radicibacter]MCR8644156.1 alpha/beta hydrolase [Paenibacillus radicibacter]
MVQVTLQTVDLSNGETLGYRERDGGVQVVLLVHGNMNSSQHWDLVMEQLDSSYKVYAVDLRGFGISTYHQKITSLADFTSDLKMFVDALGLQHFSLMGWSTGGGVVMQFAAEYPEMVEKLILLESMSTRGYPFYETDANFVSDYSRRIMNQEQMNDTIRTQVVNGANLRRDREFMRFLFNASLYNHNQPDPERYEVYLDDILTQRNLPEVYHGLNSFNISDIDGEVSKGSGASKHIIAPTLVLWGEHDLVVTKEMTDEIMEDLAHVAELVVLKGCGHSPLVDDIDQLIRNMEHFLTESEVHVDESISR